MYLNTLEVTLTSRTKNPSYRLQINQGAFDILSIIFEFKLGTGWHISRFLAQKDKSKYLYFKLRRLWESELLESFKVYAYDISVDIDDIVSGLRLPYFQYNSCQIYKEYVEPKNLIYSNATNK